jgi:ADP-ribosylation factor 1/2
MGNSVSSSSFFPCWSREPPKPHKFILHGLDASGKTSFLYTLKGGGGTVITTIPTIGFNVETLQVDGQEFVGWDVGGRDKLRPLWRHYYKDTDAVIFMVDSGDTDRMEQAKDEFHRILQEDGIRGKPMLLLCNKQDMSNSWPAAKIGDFFGVEPGNKKIHVLGCSVTKRWGLVEGLEWLVSSMEGKGIKGEDEEETDPDLSDGDPSLPPSRPELSYDPTLAGQNTTLQRFLPIQQGTHCPFAKTAKLWGGQAPEKVDKEALLQANALALAEFVERIRGNEHHKVVEPLDGFCIEIDEDPGSTPESLGLAVKYLLTGLSNLDPAQEHVMRVSYVGSRGWRFRFDRMDFFATTFAPCYSESSSRYAFDTGRAFLLLQPEISFLRYRLPPDTPRTQWEEPKTIRDKTRVAFRKAGQTYFIPRTTSYPPAEHIVKPLNDDGNTMVRWWL